MNKEEDKKDNGDDGDAEASQRFSKNEYDEEEVWYTKGLLFLHSLLSSAVNVQSLMPSFIVFLGIRREISDRC